MLRTWCCIVTGLAAALMASGCAGLSASLDDSEVALFAGRLATDVRVSETTDRPLTVADAVATARAQNYSVRVRELEVSLAEAKATAAAGALLPRLFVDNEATSRDSQPASRSSSSNAYASSSESSGTIRGATVTWSPLDLGLSYLRARQGVDRLHQQREELLRVKARIGEEVRQAFWRCAALDELESRLERLEPRITRALALSEQAGRDGSVDPMLAISLQRDLLTLQREVGQLRASLAPARGQLAHLLGSPMGIVDRRQRSDLVPPAAGGSGADVELALRRRPEIRQAMYDLRISADEVDAAVLDALPTAAFSVSHKTDSNRYLRHADWTAGSASIGVSITNLLRLVASLDAAEKQRYVHRQAAVATAAAIAMQVRVAYAQVEMGQRLLIDAGHLAKNQRRLRAQVAAAVTAGKAHTHMLVREDLASLLADVRHLMAFAERDNAIAAYGAARGDDIAEWRTERLAQ